METHGYNHRYRIWLSQLFQEAPRTKVPVAYWDKVDTFFLLLKALACLHSLEGHLG